VLHVITVSGIAAVKDVIFTLVGCWLLNSSRIPQTQDCLKIPINDVPPIVTIPEQLLIGLISFAIPVEVLKRWSRESFCFGANHD